MANASILGAALESAPGRWVAVDLSEVTFMDSAGLAALARAAAQYDEQDRSLVIRNPSRAVLRVLTLTGLDALIASSDSLSADAGADDLLD